MIVTIDEYTVAIKLIRDKLHSHESTPVALAMVAEGIHFAAPTQGEMAKILGPMHQKE